MFKVGDIVKRKGNLLSEEWLNFCNGQCKYTRGEFVITRVRPDLNIEFLNNPLAWNPINFDLCESDNEYANIGYKEGLYYG